MENTAFFVKNIVLKVKRVEGAFIRGGVFIRDNNGLFDAL